MATSPYNRLADWYDAMYSAMGVKPMVYRPELAASILDLFKNPGIKSMLDVISF